MQIYGCQNRGISDHLKCFISPMGGNEIIIGLVAEGTSRELTQNWATPFSHDTLNSAVQQAGGAKKTLGEGAIKAGLLAGQTAVTVLSSRQIWESGGHAINLVLKFQAFSDPDAEVMDPLRLLETWASPELSEFSPVSTSGLSGRQPVPISLNMGRLALFDELIIKSVSIPLDGEKHKDGALIRCTVNLALEPLTIINKSDIGATWG